VGVAAFALGIGEGIAGLVEMAAVHRENGIERAERVLDERKLCKPRAVRPGASWRCGIG